MAADLDTVKAVDNPNPFELKMLTIDSSSEVSTRWPRPVRWRASSASRIPCAAKMPARRSQMAMPSRVGPLSTVPVTLIKPDIPCAIWSKPGFSRIGPFAPNPVTLHAIIRGLRCAKAS